MPLNIPGTLVPLHLLVAPRLVIPSMVVRDIRQLDFYELRRSGYRGAVFDKDNCLTTPHKDQLVPDLKDAWRECREAFGECNVLIVSNSAGTRLDPGELQAESVTYYLSAPVLRHKVFKPSYSCISSIRKYFTSLPTPIRDDELIIVGDRIFTDIVMANRMAHGPLSIWTSGVWQREATAMRWLEKGLMQGIQRYRSKEETSQGS
ncbi:hypothetical protein PHLGIDRAFT_29464 [Phlebiopsis gigantea 11061_1 CR5-6]|uniref:HAD superfamily phosphatase n=1 Tax=Phlebiopsis gigantea (strain 11061_1 CR5-6) TaxID=745531 RepID=A0A0C3NTS1_PHLG1|nr:hypothetical protein PHLGIDRAFT_29464 [Phlebiopsis gigantea 11061_1 CR5-6]